MARDSVRQWEVEAAESARYRRAAVRYTRRIRALETENAELRARLEAAGVES